MARVASPPERATLDRNIAEMDTCARAEAAATPPTIVHDTRVIHDTRIVRTPEHRSPRLGITLGAGGLLSLGVAAYFTYDIRQLQHESDATCPVNCVWGTVASRIDRLAVRARRAELGEAAFYTAGGAALITGIVLVVLARNPETPIVTATPSSIGASWQF